MDAGREMDMLVAEKVLGWTRHESAGRLVLRAEGMGGATEQDLGGSVYFTMPDGKARYLRGAWPYGTSIEVPHFSTEWKDGAEIIWRWFADRDYPIEYHRTAVDSYCQIGMFSARAEIPAMAVCLAALQAVGVEVRP